MSITLVFLALLMGAVVSWLVKQTIDVRPWATGAHGGVVRDEGVRSPVSLQPYSTEKLGLGVFLAVVTSLFALFVSAYSIRMEYLDWRPLVEPAALWINTGILLGSSVCLQLAWNAARRSDFAAVKWGIAGGGLFAVLFIIGQLLIWGALTGSGYLIQGNPANAFFYLLTGVHALHLWGGLIALMRSARRVWSDDANPEEALLGVELCTVYWHYLFVVWVILFGLMLST